MCEFQLCQEDAAFKQVVELAGGAKELAEDFATRGFEFRKINGGDYWLILRGEGSRPGEVPPCPRLFSPQCV